MKEYFLNGKIYSENKSLGDFAVKFNFDKKIPGFEQKRGELFSLIDRTTIDKIKTLMNWRISNHEISFISEGRMTVVELKGLGFPTLKTAPLEDGKIEKIGEFSFEIFIEKDKAIDKKFNPSKVQFIIEDLVLFRPTLKGKSDMIGFKENAEIKVKLDEFENTLYFETDTLIVETYCNVLAPLTLKGEYGFSLTTEPIIFIKPKSTKIEEKTFIEAGNDLILLLSFLEERFIKYIGITLLYENEQGKFFEFRHTHYAKPMDKPWRRDLKHNMPMDKLISEDIKILYNSFLKLKNNPKIQNPSQIIYLYLNSINAEMIYYSVVNLYACIDKLLKVAPHIYSNFKYKKGKKETKHEKKVRQLCDYLEIDLNDIENKKGKLSYIQIRQDYNHNLVHKHEFIEIVNAKNKARFLARRLIFAFLGLEYWKYSSCDPRKGGQIGL